MITFQLTEYNERRAMRGAPAARFDVLEYGRKVDWLWMSKTDIERNLADYKGDPELIKGRESYRYGRMP